MFNFCWGLLLTIYALFSVVSLSNDDALFIASCASSAESEASKFAVILAKLVDNYFWNASALVIYVGNWRQTLFLTGSFEKTKALFAK